MQACDLVLIDANGRSVRVHRALLVDKSNYFAKILNENQLEELHLNENYLIELIKYLYNREVDDRQSDFQTIKSPGLSGCGLEEEDRTASGNVVDSSIASDDIQILIQLLALSKKYEFTQLCRNLAAEINYKLGPATVLTVYRCALELDLSELKNSAKIMILSWLTRLQATKEFASLPEEAIRDILDAEPLDVESDSKLNALSVWWSQNKDCDLTDLWVKLIDRV